MDNAGLLRTGHGMPADKLACESQFFHGFVDRGFDGSHICQDTVCRQHLPDGGQCFNVRFRRGTQEDHTAFGKCRVARTAADIIDQALVQCVSASFI